MTYEKSMKRLEEIVFKIENNELNIDQLSAYLKEAEEQINFCRNKLHKVDEEIKKMLDSFAKQD